MDGKQMKVDVWGVCLSRDIFDICPIEGVSVNVYYSTDPCVAMMPRMKQYRLETVDFEHLGNWRARNACFEFNREVVDKYANSGSNWLVADLRLMTYSGYQISENGKIIGYTGCWLNSHLSENDIARYIASKYGKNIEVKSVDREQLHTEEFFEAWCDFINRRYGNNVILIVPAEASFGEMDDGRIVTNAKRSETFINNFLENQWTIKFTSRVHCHVLIIPDSVIADYNHKWGYNPVNYDVSVYHIIHDAISKLMFYPRENTVGEHALLTMRTATFSKMVGRDNYLETKLQKARKEFDEIKSKEDFDEFKKHYDELVSKRDDPTIIAEYARLIGISYRDGRFVSKDADAAKRWLSRAAVGSDIACYNLFDILWLDKSDDAWMASIANAMLSHGNGWAMNRIGRMYQYGRFYEKNLDEAKKWMKKAISVGELWANNELFDLLWQIGTPESYSEMIEVARKQILLGDPNAKYRMAHAFQYGKGVEKNTSKALELMKEAVSKNNYWFNELKTMGIDFEVISGKNWKIIRKIGFLREKRDILSIVHRGFFIDITNFKLIHKITNSVLFLPAGLDENVLSYFVRYGIYDEIIEYDWTVGFKDSKFNSRESIIEFFNAMFKEANIELTDIRRFFTMADVHDQIGAFIRLSGIDVTVIEFTPGSIDNKERYELGKFFMSDDLYNLQKETDILCNFNGARIRQNTNKINDESNFDYNDSFNRLDEVDKHLLSIIFNASQYDGAEVVVTNSPTIMIDRFGLHPNNWSHMASVLLDQFIDDGSKIIIKLHPYSWDDYRFKIRNVKIVDGKINLDSVRYNPKVCLKKLVSMTSSVVGKIAAQCENIVAVGGDFYTQYLYYPIVEYFMFVTQGSEIAVLQDVINSESWDKSKLCKNCKDQNGNIQRSVLITNKLKDSECAAVVIVDDIAENGIEKEYKFRTIRNMQIDDGYGIQNYVLKILSKEKELFSLLISPIEFTRRYLTIRLTNTQ
ncbi:tetratricopeptide repeat protein [Methanomassiliicoccales archaeon LGM-DZ1]|nr:tetratricopeptide repeat protein [Methanomassiliicoccales archaeon LGM-DZ1]